MDSFRQLNAYLVGNSKIVEYKTQTDVFFFFRKRKFFDTHLDIYDYFCYDKK